MLGRRRLTGAFFIEIDRIRPDPSQPRRAFDPDQLRDLRHSIERLGILQPIAVRYVEHDDIYQIISGQRRYEAAKAAGLHEIPCWVQAPQEQEILVRQIVENWQRSDLNPFELADALAKLRDTNGYTQKQLAEATGKSESEISKLLSILDLDPTVQKKVREDDSNRLSKRHLYAVAQLPQSQQPEIVRTIESQTLSAAESEQLVAKSKRRNQGIAKRGVPVNRIRYTTKHATVILSFRKQEVTTDEILEALDEARKAAEFRKAIPLNIVRLDTDK